MPVDDGTDFSQAILEEAKLEAEGILDLARKEAERILDDARAELEQITLAERSHAATQTAKMRYKQIIAAAELETQKQKLLKQEELITEVQEHVKERLLQIRKKAQYPELLSKLILRGVTLLDGDEFEILVAPEDRERVTENMLTQLSKETGVTLKLSERSFPGITGAIIQRADQRVRCDNSLQSILQRRNNEMRLLIAENLFGDIETL